MVSASHLVLGPVRTLLASEPWARALLSAHAGQSARLKIASVPFCFVVTTEGNLATPAAEQAPDVSISIAASALPELLRDPTSMSKHAQISGNAAFAETLQTLLRHLRPDLGAALSPWLGDVVANRVDLVLRGASKGLVDALGSIGDSLSVSIGDSGLLLKRDAFAVFREEVEKLTAQLEHLEKRISS